MMILNRKLIVSVVFVTAITSVLFYGCGQKNNSKPSNNIPNQQIPAKNSQKGNSNANNTDLKYNVSEISSDTKIEYNTTWEISPNKNYKATIEGKGDRGQEEGYSQIIIRDEKTGRLTMLSLADEGKKELAAKDIEWIDENTLFVIIGDAYGTVTTGGKIYKVNITDGSVELYKDTPSSKVEFTSVHRSQEGFTYEKHVYEDDSFTKGHIEKGILK
jgi:hypothetical protein